MIHTLSCLELPNVAYLTLPLGFLCFANLTNCSFLFLFFLLVNCFGLSRAEVLYSAADQTGGRIERAPFLVLPVPLPRSLFLLLPKLRLRKERRKEKEREGKRRRPKPKRRPNSYKNLKNREREREGRGGEAAAALASQNI